MVALFCISSFKQLISSVMPAHIGISQDSWRIYKLSTLHVRC